MENITLKTSSLVQISVQKATELSELCEYCTHNGITYQVLGSYIFIERADIPKLVEAGYISDEDDRDPSSYEYPRD